MGDDDDDRHYLDTNHFWGISYPDRFRIFFGDNWKTYFDSHGRISRYADDTNDNLVHNGLFVRFAHIFLDRFARNLFAHFARSLFGDRFDIDFFALSYVRFAHFAPWKESLVHCFYHNLEIWTILFRFQRSNFVELILGFADNFAFRWHVPDNLQILGWLFLVPISAFE